MTFCKTKNKLQAVFIFAIFCNVFILSGCGGNREEIADKEDINMNTDESVINDIIEIESCEEIFRDNVLDIDIIEDVTINGVKQWIYIRSENKDNPVLLFLHGGPGFPGIAVAHAYQAELEKNFTVVQWDQRGAGKSYCLSIPVESMNIDQFISDLYEVVKYLKSTLDYSKIYLAGHSWGALLGMLTIDQYPELFDCFISIGQFVNARLNYESCLPFLLDEANKRGDNEAVRRINLFQGNAWNEEYDYVVKYGGAWAWKSNLSQLMEIMSSSSLYDENEKRSIPMGMDFSCRLLYNVMASTNLFDEVKSIDIPVLFIVGKHDKLTSTDVVTKYYEELIAPQKRIVYFSNSAHFPFLEETDYFCEVINNIDLLLGEEIPNDGF